MISFNVSPLRNPSLQISRKHSEVWRHFPPFIEMFTKDFMIFTGPRCLWGLVYGSRSLYLCHSNTVCWDFAVVTLADDDTNSILTDDANRAIWNWWWSLRWWWCSNYSRDAQCGLWGHQGGRQGGARVAGNIGAVIMLATMYVVGPLCRWWLSLRWWWMSRTIGRCTRWKRWSPRNGQRLIVLTLDFSSFRLQAWFL